jgi:hypothetical protein
MHSDTDSYIHSPRYIALLVAWLFVLAPSARAAAVDWKFYGGADLTITGQTVCFYEERGITKPQPSLVNVWVKCLLQSDMDKVPAHTPYSNAYISMSVGRLAHYYHPPILRVERMNYDQIVQVIMYESLADVSDLTAHAQFYYGLDCRRRMMREMSITIENQQGKPSDWQYVPPEGNGARLLSLLCQ